MTVTDDRVTWTGWIYFHVVPIWSQLFSQWSLTRHMCGENVRLLFVCLAHLQTNKQFPNRKFIMHFCYWVIRFICYLEAFAFQPMQPFIDKYSNYILAMLWYANGSNRHTYVTAIFLHFYSAKVLYEYGLASENIKGSQTFTSELYFLRMRPSTIGILGSMQYNY